MKKFIIAIVTIILIISTTCNIVATFKVSSMNKEIANLEDIVNNNSTTTNNSENTISRDYFYAKIKNSFWTSNGYGTNKGTLIFESLEKVTNIEIIFANQFLDDVELEDYIYNIDFENNKLNIWYNSEFSNYSDYIAFVKFIVTYDDGRVETIIDNIAKG